jgi:hypothetical protein
MGASARPEHLAARILLIVLSRETGLDSHAWESCTVLRLPVQEGVNYSSRGTTMTHDPSTGPAHNRYASGYEANATEPITSLEASGGRRYRGRPVGVVVLVLLQAAHSVAVALSIRLPAALTMEPVPLIEGLAPVNPAALPISLAGLAIAAGIWWMRRWAWFAATFWVGASMAGALVSYFDGEPAYPVMAISVAVVIYLNQKEVRRAFRAARGEEARA